MHDCLVAAAGPDIEAAQVLFANGTAGAAYSPLRKIPVRGHLDLSGILIS